VPAQPHAEEQGPEHTEEGGERPAHGDEGRERG